MNLIESLGRVEGVNLGDVVTHPIFESIKVSGIFEKDDKRGFEVFCTLLDFNNTVRVFDLNDIVSLKYSIITETKLRAVE